MDKYKRWAEKNHVLYEGIRAGLSESEIIIKLCELSNDLKDEHFRYIEKYGQNPADYICFSVKEVSEAQGLSIRTIQRYIKAGTLKSRKTARGSVRIPAAEVERVFGLVRSDNG